VVLIPIILFTSCSTDEAFKYHKTPNYNSPKVSELNTSEKSPKTIDFNQLSENQTPSASQNSFNEETGRKKVNVVDVVNGDTIVYLENGIQKTAHLIGVESPSNVTQSNEAKAYLKQLVLGKEIEIEGEPKAGLVDEFGRVLIYGFIGGRSIQYILLEQGLVYASHHYKDEKYKELYQKGETIAKDAKTNIWNSVPNISDKANGSNLKDSVTSVKTKILDAFNKFKEKSHP
jgi:micrococcal nuclease